MQLKQFFQNRKTAQRPAKFSYDNIKAVIQSFFRKKRMNMAGFELPLHIYEQIIWRRICVKSQSPMCWYTGACKVCGCDILGKTMEDRGCSILEHPDLLKKREPCYPAMMNEKEWKEFKKKKNIKLFD